MSRRSIFPIEGNDPRVRERLASGSVSALLADRQARSIGATLKPESLPSAPTVVAVGSKISNERLSHRWISYRVAQRNSSKLQGVRRHRPCSVKEAKLLSRKEPGR